MIHITSVGKISFSFDFIIFSHLQFTAGDFKFFQYIQVFFALILANLNPFVSFVSLFPVDCEVCRSSLCSGTGTL